MTEPAWNPDVDDLTKPERHPTYIITIAMVIAALLGFMAGRIVESTHSNHMQKDYLQQIQELEQQLKDNTKRI
jgi:hypothetical protein